MLNNDTDSGERARAVNEKAVGNHAQDKTRALHRVVRAMHDGECPKCHNLFDCEQMRVVNRIGAFVAHRCPDCGFEISKEESAAALDEFSVFMDRNLEVFEQWRTDRKAKRN